MNQFPILLGLTLCCLLTGGSTAIASSRPEPSARQSEVLLQNRDRTQPSAQTTHNQQQVIEQCQNVVVKLFGAGVGTLDSYGSGVLVSETGHVVTVWNHLINTGFLTAVVADGRRFTVTVVGTSAEHDLAVLKLNADEGTVFPFLDGRTAVSGTSGQSVMAFSNVFHVATGNEPVSVLHGFIACTAPLNAGLGRWQFPVKSPVYIIDAITNNSGAAGGLVTSTHGQPLGLLGREIRLRDTDMWVNYAVPWTTLQPVITSIVEGRRIAPDKPTDAQQKLLSDRDLTNRYGMTLLQGILTKTPAYIDRVIPGSPAAVSGLRRGDLVLMVNDQVIQSVDDLRLILAGLRKNLSITLTITRDDALQTISLQAQ